MRSFVSHFEYESNQYIKEEISQACIELCKDFKELLEFLAEHNCPSTGDDENLYRLFPRSDPLFSLYLDRTSNNADLNTEEIRKKYDEFLDFTRDVKKREEFAQFVGKNMPLLYQVTLPNSRFTVYDYKKEYYKHVRLMADLLNHVESEYREYRSAIKRNLGV